MTPSDPNDQEAEGIKSAIDMRENGELNKSSLHFEPTSIIERVSGLAISPKELKSCMSDNDSVFKLDEDEIESKPVNNRERILVPLHSNSSELEEIDLTNEEIKYMPVRDYSDSSNDNSLDKDLDDIDRCESVQVQLDESGLGSSASSWDRTIAEVKEHAFAKLQEELQRAHEELKLKDEEVLRLSRIRKEVEAELEEFTASLFQEANNMVLHANVKHAQAEKALKEKTMEAEVLSAEVVALKTLVLTSTPSRPNPHLHPQLEREDSASGFFRKHRRSPSHYNLKYGRENSPPNSPEKDDGSQSTNGNENGLSVEIDPVVHKEFLSWRQSPTTDKLNPFIARIYAEDINHCLDFSNKELGDKVRSAIETGDVFIEAVSDKSKNNFPKKCALLETVRQCQYRLKLGESNTWYSISQMCRNRIIAVCDLLNYLRYVQQGLVKSSCNDIYTEVVRLRKEILLARLGLPTSS